MSRFQSRWAFAALIGGLAWVSSAGPASAQHMPFVGGVRPWGPAWSPYYNNYNTFSRTTAAYSFVNPYTGGVHNYQFNYNRFTYGPAGYALGGYGGGYSAPAAGYLPWNTTAGGYGAYGASSNPVTQQQLRLLRGASYQSRPAYSSDPAPNGPRWTVDPADKAKTVAKPSDLNETLLRAAEPEVLSGRALNSLAIEIRKLEEKGAKADSPLLPAEVLARVAYEGSGARLLTATRSGKPEFPRPLTGAPFADLRANVERHFVAAVEPVAQGRATDAAADRLADAALKAKTDPALRHLSDGDAADATKFLDGLIELAKQIKDPSLAGIAPKWGPTGATASELVRHMGRHRLFFAPAPAGSEEAYGALHRGLSGYYVALARAKK